MKDRRQPDLRVYAITPDTGTVEWISAAVKRVLDEGATCIQLRSKHLAIRDQIRLGHELRALTRAAGVHLIVNDRPDLALAIDADGVHVGQDDLPVAWARRLLGPGAIIGVSVENPDEAQAAEAASADYVGTGPIFATYSKADAGEPYGVQLAADISRSTRLPVVAIGGITPANAAQVIAAGADGVAVISAVFGPQGIGAAKQLRQVVDRALAKRLGEKPSAPGAPSATNYFSLHFIADRQRLGNGWQQLISSLTSTTQDGQPLVDWYHARDRQATTGDFLSYCQRLQSYVTSANSGLIINDRCDIAVLTGQGVQLPEQGLTVAQCRRILGYRGLVGRSVHDLSGALQAVNQGADFLLVGHIFPTRSKPGLPPLGVERLAEIVDRVPVPVIAIGGIKVENVQAVLATGCSGIAVIEAIAAAEDPVRSAKALKRLLLESPVAPGIPFPAPSTQWASGHSTAAAMVDADTERGNVR